MVSRTWRDEILPSLYYFIQDDGKRLYPLEDSLLVRLDYPFFLKLSGSKSNSAEKIARFRENITRVGWFSGWMTFESLSELPKLTSVFTGDFIYPETHNFSAIPEGVTLNHFVMKPEHIRPALCCKNITELMVTRSLSNPEFTDSFKEVVNTTITRLEFEVFSRPSRELIDIVNACKSLKSLEIFQCEFLAPEPNYKRLLRSLECKSLKSFVLSDTEIEFDRIRLLLEHFSGVSEIEISGILKATRNIWDYQVFPGILPNLTKLKIPVDYIDFIDIPVQIPNLAQLSLDCSVPSDFVVPAQIKSVIELVAANMKTLEDLNLSKVNWTPDPRGLTRLVDSILFENNTLKSLALNLPKKLFSRLMKHNHPSIRYFTITQHIPPLSVEKFIRLLSNNKNLIYFSSEISKTSLKLWEDYSYFDILSRVLAANHNLASLYLTKEPDFRPTPSHIERLEKTLDSNHTITSLNCLEFNNLLKVGDYAPLFKKFLIHFIYPPREMTVL